MGVSHISVCKIKIKKINKNHLDDAIRLLVRQLNLVLTNLKTAKDTYITIKADYILRKGRNYIGIKMTEDGFEVIGDEYVLKDLLKEVSKMLKMCYTGVVLNKIAARKGYRIRASFKQGKLVGVMTK